MKLVMMDVKMNGVTGYVLTSELSQSLLNQLDAHDLDAVEFVADVETDMDDDICNAFLGIVQLNNGTNIVELSHSEISDIDGLNEELAAELQEEMQIDAYSSRIDAAHDYYSGDR